MNFNNSLLTFDKNSSIIATNLSKGGIFMKRLLCLLAALLLLTGCDSVRLRRGYYLLPLEETEGVPFYFCLDL